MRFRRKSASILLIAVSVSAFVLAAMVATSGADEFSQAINTEPSATRSMSAAEVCKTAKLPPGFKMTAFAVEPLVQNPIAISTDDQGRLWVAENYTWAGADAGNFDSKLHDRAIVLIDTNGDGKADKRTVFYDRAKRLTSLQVGMGGVWLLCPPQLLFVPDQNRDDVPDGPPEVVLDGFDLGSSTHTVANGLKWGPDGWLYGRQGILGTSKIGVPGSEEASRVTMNTGIWRYHPTRRVVEAVMHGMTNPWGFDYDQFGECFVTNTVIGHLWHVVPGARTERMSGSDFNPHAYQLIAQTADHVHWDVGEVWQDVRKGVTDRTSEAGGGHAHTGLMIYQGDNWPSEYRGRAYTINFHGRRLNSDILKRAAVDYTASHGPDMCFIADPWFRGMDLISGADGGVFIADWSDTGECHEIGGVHRTSGRIYRLTHAQAENDRSLNIGAATDEQLVNWQASKNDWYSRRARLVLQERAASKELNVPICRERLLELYQSSSDPVVRVRALWSLWLAQLVDAQWLIDQLEDSDEHVRVWAVRFLADECSGRDAGAWPEVVEGFVERAKIDRSGLVLLYLASAMQKLPAEGRWQLAEALGHRTETSFSSDRTLAIMLWLGIEPEIVGHPERSLALLKSTTFSLVREDIARRLAHEIDSRVGLVEQLLAIAAEEPQLKADIVNGIAAALIGRNKIPVPANWSHVAAKLRSDSDAATLDSLNSIGITFRDPQTLAELRQNVEARNVEPSLRGRALEQLLAAHPADMPELLRGLIRDPDLGLVAIRGLASYRDSKVPKALLAAYPNLSVEQRMAAINTLAARIEYAGELVDALEKGQLAASEVSAVQARQVLALGDEALSRRFQDVWGDVRQSEGDKRQVIGTLRSTLTPILAKSDIASGKLLFEKHCASCHTLFGKGAKIGPELTGSDRKNLDYLLENIVDPSTVVPAAYRANIFVLSDGRVVTGIIREQNDKTITIETQDGKQVVDRENIEESTVSDKSLMPDGLLQTLQPEQIRDLFGYVMSDG